MEQVVFLAKTVPPMMYHKYNHGSRLDIILKEDCYYETDKKMLNTLRTEFLLELYNKYNT